MASQRRIAATDATAHHDGLGIDAATRLRAGST
jgi:hypothetical protein